MHSTLAPETWGLVQVFTGNGKGKTSAAMGCLLRAMAVKKRVALLAFDKGGDHYTERRTLAARFPEVDVFATGLDRMDQKAGTFRFGVTEEDRGEGIRALRILQWLFVEPRHDVVILDEINTAVYLGIVDEPEVLALLKTKPAAMELILTGQHAPPSFLALADLVTDMRLIKHYLYQGVRVREGMDY